MGTTGPLLPPQKPKRGRPARDYRQIGRLPKQALGKSRGDLSTKLHRRSEREGATRPGVGVGAA
jgi:hypothetical protein